MYEVYGNLHRHIPYLWDYARAISHNSLAAEDLVQRTLARALYTAHSYKTPNNLKAWLFTIMHNQYVASLRESRRDVRAMEGGFSPPPESPSNDAGDTVGTAVRMALQMMQEEQRVLLELMDQDRDFKASPAKCEDRSPNSDGSNCNRGRAPSLAMRRRTRGRGIAAPAA